MRLNITNGDSAGKLIQAVVGDEPVLPWRDMLHEGPVPAGLSLDELSAARARFIAAFCGLDLEATLLTFADRDRCLEIAGTYDGVTLWFEHDLYDQLQLLQILHELASMPDTACRISLIQAASYLGCMSTSEIAALHGAQRTVGEAVLDLAQRAWSAFRAPTPVAVVELRCLDLTPLPYLQSALERLLQELPEPDTGLCRTERLILEQLREAGRPARRLYKDVQRREPAVFMGDLPFFRRLERLALAHRPMITGVPAAGLLADASGGEALDRPLSITPDGRRVLAGAADWLDCHSPDRWFGGTHLRPGHLWRWDAAAGELFANAASGSVAEDGGGPSRRAAGPI